MLCLSTKSFAKKSKTLKILVRVVPSNYLLLEMGYFGYPMIEVKQGHSFPNPTLRVGLWKNTEYLLSNSSDGNVKNSYCLVIL